MTQSEEDMLRGIIDRMDAPDLREAIIRLSKKLGIRQSINTVVRIADRLGPDPWQRVYDRTLYELRVEGILWRNAPDEYRDVDPAFILRSALGNAFQGELEFLLATEPGEAPDFVLAIAEGLKDGDSTLFEDGEELRKEYLEHIMQCVDSGTFRDALGFRPLRNP